MDDVTIVEMGEAEDIQEFVRQLHSHLATKRCVEIAFTTREARTLVRILESHPDFNGDKV